MTYQMEEVRPRDRSVEETESVLSGLNFEKWPWNTIDSNDVSKCISGHCKEIEQRSIRIELLGHYHQWNIVVSCGKAKVLCWIRVMKDIEA